MKLIKKANGKTYLRISKKEWEDVMVRFAKMANITPWGTLKARLLTIKWRIELNAEGHYNCYSPNRGIKAVVINPHNYEEHAAAVKQDILRRDKNLWFLFEEHWDPPKGFNINTGKMENPQANPQATQSQVPVINLTNLDRAPADLVPNYDMLIDNKWLRPVEIDWIGKTIMTADGDIHKVPPSNIPIRKNKP